ncbi:MAG: hypothetical protein U9N85_02485 [Bacteroidota bacterium]|nr:hypothetical protein [Bacteroidota bacterium]
MKNLNLLIGIVITGLFFSCNKTEDLPADRIMFVELDKIITFSNPDSICGTCKDLIFEIEKINSSENTAIVKLNDKMIDCDGFDNIRADSDNGNVLLFDVNKVISENGNWKNVNGICLDEFAGKGEKYIGYRSGFYPSGFTNYNYGWIKIELSSDKKTLKIIDRATNYTENKFIKAGQTE